MFLTGVTSCDNKPQENPEPEKKEITLDKETLTFLGTGGSETVTVTGEDWTTDENESWILIEEFAGSFKVTVDPNPVDEAREAAITVSNSDDSKTVTVKQGAASSDIMVDLPSLTFDGQGGKKTVAVTSEIPEWTAVPAEGSEWLTVTPNYSNNTFEVTVGAYIEDGDRQGSITVGNGKQEATVEVTQEEIPWIELVSFRSGYSRWGDDETLFNPVLQFWDSPINANGPMNPFAWWVIANPVAVCPDLTARHLDIPEGTYTFGPSNSTPPFLYNDGYNNYISPVVDGYATIGDIVDATWGEMVVTGEGDARTVEIIYDLEDNTVFKARYNGSTVFSNPFVSGLVADVDLGTMDMTGLAVCDESLMSWGLLAAWTFHICSEGLTLDETDTPQGTGYYIRVSALTNTSDGQPRSPAEDGTYEFTNPNILSTDGGLFSGASGSADTGSWLYRYEDGEMMERTPLDSGTIAISHVDPNYTFVFDVIEKNGYNVRGTLTGELPFRLSYVE